MASDQSKADADEVLARLQTLTPQRMITIRLTNEQHSQIANAAQSTGFSLNSYILIRLGFDVEPTGKPRGRKPQPR